VGGWKMGRAEARPWATARVAPHQAFVSRAPRDLNVPDPDARRRKGSTRCASSWQCPGQHPHPVMSLARLRAARLRATGGTLHDRYGSIVGHRRPAAVTFPRVLPSRCREAASLSLSIRSEICVPCYPARDSKQTQGLPMTDLATNVKSLRAHASECRKVAFITAGSDDLLSDAYLELASRFEDLAAIEVLARHGPFLDQFVSGRSPHQDGV
jgi:hypothetical protein